MKIRPLYDRINVRVLKPAEMSKGGIIFPENHAKPSSAAVVLDVGPGKNFDGPGETTVLDGAGNVLMRHVNKPKGVNVAVGDVVFFGRYSGTEVDSAGKTVTILREDEILAVVNYEEGEPRPFGLEESTEEERPANVLELRPKDKVSEDAPVGA